MKIMKKVGEKLKKQQEKVRHEQFEYDRARPFHIFLAMSDDADLSRFMNHWHEDLEVVYGFAGCSRHYINGECVMGSPGRLVVTNANFIHSILPDESIEGKHILVKIIVVISPRFVEENLPEHDEGSQHDDDGTDIVCRRRCA